MGKCIVCCICKNESSYIEEFIEYHLELGFDKIIIGDNNDLDGESYDDQLKDYIEYGEVEIINLRGKTAIQKVFYNDIIDNYDYEWCAFIDCDEFITFGNDSKFDNIKDFLESNDNIKAYALNWMCYGDNGRVFRGNGDVIDRFPKPMPINFTFHYDFPENSHVKSILNKVVNGHFTKNPHNVFNSNFKYYTPGGIEFEEESPFNKNLEHTILYVRHFYTKSLEEWVNKKMKSKYADCVESNLIKYYPIEDYFMYNQKTDAKIKYLRKNGINYAK